MDSHILITGRETELTQTITLTAQKAGAVIVQDKAPPADVSADILFDALVAGTTRVDAVIHPVAPGTLAAGQTKLHKTPTYDWDRLVIQPLRDAYLLTQAAVYEFLSSGTPGHIILIDKVATNGSGHWMARHSALRALTRSVAREYGRRNIYCHAILFHFQEQSGTRATPQASQTPAELHEIQPELLPSYAAEVSEWVLYLVSEHASFMNGETLTVTHSVQSMV